jgi:hypothetical protein
MDKYTYKKVPRTIWDGTFEILLNEKPIYTIMTTSYLPSNKEDEKRIATMVYSLNNMLDQK